MFNIISSIFILFSLLLGNGSYSHHLDWSNQKLIAHAMGGIDGKTYSNSYEAFVLSYSNGLRLFEVDLSLTSDDKLVARHDWDEIYTQYLQQIAQSSSGSWTHDYFMNQKIFKEYTPLDINQIIKLMQEHDDMYIVTDTKSFETDVVKRQFKLIVDAAKNDSEILNRVIPQIYNQQMLDDVKSVYNFPNIIYTLYLTSDTEQQVVDFVKDKRIKVVTMPENKANLNFITTLKKNGILTFVHTINSMEVVKKYKTMGVHGFYTDFLTEEDLEGLNTITE